jgi:hypothetical protein
MTSEKSGAAGTETYLLDNSWQRARERLDMLGAFLDPGRFDIWRGWGSMRVGSAGK